MAETEIYRVAMQYRAALRVENDAALARLVQSYGRIYQRLQEKLEALQARILARQAAGEPFSVDWLRKQRRYQELMVQLREELERYSAVLEAEVDSLARAGIAAAERDALALTVVRMPVLGRGALRSVWNRLPSEAVETLLGFLAEGSPLDTWLRGFGEAAAKRAGKALTESIALGFSPRDLAQVLRGQVGLPLTDALRVARTAQINAYREASRATYVANSRLVPTWTWVSALDPAGTCMACVARHGSVHPVSERLNDHDNGWCVMVPNPVSYRELGLDVEGPGMETIPTGADWFAGLGSAQQQAMLPSEAAWRAWQEGKVRVGDFLGRAEHDVWGEVVQEMSLTGILGEAAKAYYGGGGG